VAGARCCCSIPKAKQLHTIRRSRGPIAIIRAMQRIKHWSRLLWVGCRAVPAIISYITLVVGGSVALTFTWGRKHLFWSIVLLLAAVVVTLLEGSYREAQNINEINTKKLDEVRAKHAEELIKLRSEHVAAVAEAQAKPAAPIRAPTFFNGGILTGNEITNTYNESTQTVPGQEGFKGKLIDFGPGTGISGSEVNVRFGPPPPPPDPLISSAEQRAQLRVQLFKLATQVEVVMEPWKLSTVDIAKMMGIPSDQFMERIAEIWAELHRTGDEATARYNSECRAAVIQTYGYARSIGFVDREMESCWQTRLGAGASGIPARLRAIGKRIQD
jgi:hypothetical protein